jgi:hypothetical protein
MSVLRTDNIETFKGAQYRVVRGYPDYLVSEYGVIIHRTKGFVKVHTNKTGYRFCRLKDSTGKWMSWFVHRFVATAWIENPTRKPTVNHIDGVKHNNVVSNLEWATMKEQIDHAHGMGLIVHKSGQDHWAHGITLSKEQKEKMSLAKTGERHPRFKGYYITPLGKFSSVRSAGHAHGWSGVYFSTRFAKEILNATPGWSFEGDYSSVQIKNELQRRENPSDPEITKKRMSDSKLGERHPKFKGWYVTPIGRFINTKEGGEAYGISRVGFFRKFNREVKKGTDGWTFDRIPPLAVSALREKLPQLEHKIKGRNDAKYPFTETGEPEDQ